MRARVLLADDHTLVLEGLRKILEDDFDLVGLAEDGRALVEMATRLEPDVIVLDISMPKLNGLDAARQLKKLLPTTKLIFLTMHGDVSYANEAFRAGASGYLLKRSAGSELIQAIHAVLKDQCYMTPAITKEVLDSCLQTSTPSPVPSDKLTPRQREVLQLVAEGKSTKDIATILNISIKTVEFHKSHIMRELDLHTTAELTKYAIAQGIVSPE
ncbi:response regulator transcription factor [Candidatus Nitronereus thalassa]|uniref:Response regulator transcription factor n=1 Tax=Candidatus Nitronereus thalassa TaxID=3020898 RepID=A0ABU3K8M0_9BACT|nr:response regulator transcription factor [Candidatus Nitronereus thalassa]MDT7042790.1 response regulator transcription factor [Candidatus Nitronereus thalassa]